MNLMFWAGTLSVCALKASTCPPPKTFACRRRRSPPLFLHGPDQQLHGVNAEAREIGRPIAVAGRREKEVIHSSQPQRGIVQADGDAGSHDRLDHGRLFAT